MGEKVAPLKDVCSSFQTLFLDVGYSQGSQFGEWGSVYAQGSEGEQQKHDL
jgi:hypothetical protein